MARTEGEKASRSEQGVPDFFVERSMFADPQQIFDFKLKSLEAMKNDAFVALDANVLLMPYQLEQASLATVANVYKHLADQQRLVVPAQAAREFAKWRSQKLAEVVKYLRDECSRIQPLFQKQAPLLTDDEDYQAAQRLADEIVDRTKQIRKRIRAIEGRISGNVTHDPVSDAYRNIFGNCVFNDDDIIADKEQFCADRDARYAARRPPGYKDGSKPDGGGGDLLIWYTILSVARSTSRNCIFVTADEKGDWYQQSDGRAFQARYELIDEYRMATDGCSLQIVPLSRLLELYEADAKAVKDARQVEEKVLLARTLVRDTAMVNNQQALRDCHAEVDEINRKIVELQAALDRGWIGNLADVQRSFHIAEISEKEARRHEVEREIRRLREEMSRLIDDSFDA